MVATHLNAGEHDNITGTNGPVNYGPLTVTAGFTITEITVRGGVSFPGITTSSIITFINFLQHGIQHGAIGYTPTNAESLTAPGSEWLKFQGIEPSQGALAYTVAASGNAESERYNVSLTWRGQFYSPNGTDVYYSVGRIYNASINWNFHGNLVVTYG